MSSQSTLSPNVALIVFNLMLAKQVDELFFECYSPVMCVLAAYIFQHIRDIRFAHAEGAIAQLPGKGPSARPSVVHPTRRIRFQEPKSIRYRNNRWQT